MLVYWQLLNEWQELIDTMMYCMQIQVETRNNTFNEMSLVKTLVVRCFSLILDFDYFEIIFFKLKTCLYNLTEPTMTIVLTTCIFSKLILNVILA